MPDSADGAFNEIEDVADKVDDAQDRWDKMKPDEKVFYFQTEFGAIRQKLNDSFQKRLL